MVYLLDVFCSHINLLFVRDLCLPILSSSLDCVLKHPSVLKYIKCIKYALLVLCLIGIRYNTAAVSELLVGRASFANQFSIRKITNI